MEVELHEHLNDAENVGTVDRGNGGNYLVSATEDRNEQTTTLREVRNLHRLIVRIWIAKQLAAQWKERVIGTIRKKGGHLECDN